MRQNRLSTYLTASIKEQLTRAGSCIPSARLLDVQSVLNYMKLGRWMRDQGFSFPSLVNNREQLFDMVGEYIGHQPVLYLEFGVWKGESIRYWSTVLTHADSKLHGFDSFEGLPEEFDPRRGLTKGHLSVGGQTPSIQDNRVVFFRGWFEDTLPVYSLPPHERLIINFDADLYSSTKCVLKHLSDYVKPGTFFYFDDFNFIDHEAKAFAEYLQDSGHTFVGFGAEKTLNRCVFQCVS